MDCTGSYHPHPGEWYRHLRDAENTGEQESSKEKDSRKCGNEWRKLLCSPSPALGHAHAHDHAHGQGRIAASFDKSTSHERRS